MFKRKTILADLGKLFKSRYQGRCPNKSVPCRHSFFTFKAKDIFLRGQVPSYMLCLRVLTICVDHVCLPCVLIICVCHVCFQCVFSLRGGHVCLPCVFAMCVLYVWLPCVFAMCVRNVFPAVILGLDGICLAGVT